LTDLDTSQESIVGTSSYFIRLGEAESEMAVQIEKLWRDKLLEAPLDRKVPFIFLANDLI